MPLLLLLFCTFFFRKCFSSKAALSMPKNFLNASSLSLLFILVLPVLSMGCSRAQEELPLIPPSTNPLSREYIGYGVINGSFIHLLNEPGTEAVSQGYLRRGTVVRILERRAIIDKEKTELWVLAEGNYDGQGNVTSGWLEETTVEIYDSESRAKTASKAMNK